MTVPGAPEAVIDDRTGAADDTPSLRATVVTGLAVVALFFGGLMGWTLFAQLNSAVIAQGAIVVDSHRKTVQHLEGGIVRKILVKEGDKVSAGQVLIALDSTQADAAYEQLMNQLWTVKARIVRLMAEQNGLRTIEFPPDIVSRADTPSIAALIAAQKQLFEARWQTFDSTIAVTKSKIDQLNAAIASSQSQIDSTRDQQVLTEKEQANVQELYAKGYERLPRLMALQKSVAELQARLSELRGDIAKARQEIAGAELQINGARNNRLAEIGKDAEDARAIEADLTEKLRAAADVRQRRVIAAPQDGVVVDLKVFTPGGVIAPGEPVLDIVPANDSLVVEAKVRPADIDSVRAGLPAQVMLTAYKRSEVPLVDGRVITVSADKLSDARTGETYFSTRVAVNPEPAAKLKGVKLQPGMPAEVMVQVGERRAIDYFLEPLTERMRRAFREQ